MTLETTTSGVVSLKRQYRVSKGVKLPSLGYYRKQLALSQLDLAIKAGVGRSTVSRGERGEEIRVSSVRRLAKALHVTPAQLQQQPPRDA